MRELLCAICYIHQKGWIHRDLTSTNILINEEFTIKICDFGLSKEINQRPHTPKMCTLQYSAPEILIGATNYTNSVDIWSCGCIFIELILGKLAFDEESEVKILRQQLLLLGTPNLWPELPPSIKLPSFPSKLSSIFPSSFPPEAIDFAESR